MHELLHYASGARAPIVMANVNRTIASVFRSIRPPNPEQTGRGGKAKRSDAGVFFHSLRRY